MNKLARTSVPALCLTATAKLKKMKYISAMILLIGTFTALGCSGTSNTNVNAPVPTKEVTTQIYRSTGIVKRVDKEKGTVTVDHEDIPGYMSPMEMTEPVAEIALLDAVKAGDKVDFAMLRTGDKIKYTEFKKTGEVALVTGSDIYAASCAECHGAKGEGAEKGIPFTSGHALDHSEADFIRIVTNGKSKKKHKEMPAFRDKLTAEQIAAVVKFVREDIQKGLTRNEGHKH
jgi:mono/diheme cytochrome c family protein